MFCCLLSSILYIIPIIGTLLVTVSIGIWLYQFYLPKNFVQELNKRSIFITGCDSGFGNALTKYLDSLDCKVFAACLTEDGKEKIAKECSINVVPLILDVTNQDSIDCAFETVKKHLPESEGLWAIVNNAGVSTCGLPFDLLPISHFQTVMNINAFGTLRVSKTFIPLLKKSKGGRLVNMISAAGKLSFPFWTPYSMSKFAIEAFTDSIRNELSLFGLSVHGIEPSFFKTSLASCEQTITSYNRMWDTNNEELKTEYEDFNEYGKKMLRNIDKMCETDIQPVVDAMVHAILSETPKSRYVVGKRNLFIYYWMYYLPCYITDMIIKRKTLQFKPTSMKT